MVGVQLCDLDNMDWLHSEIRSWKWLHSRMCDWVAESKSGTGYPVFPVRHVPGVLMAIILAVVTRGRSRSSKYYAHCNKRGTSLLEKEVCAVGSAFFLIN